MIFTRCEAQHPEIHGHPLRGAGALPSVTTIPEQLFDQPHQLFNHCFGNTFFGEILKATNFDNIKNNPNYSKSKRFDILSHSDLSTFFGLKTLMSMYKGRLERQQFLTTIKKNPDLYGIINYDPMTLERFQYITNHIDVGETDLCDNTFKGKPIPKPNGREGEKVQIWNIKDKFQPVVNKLNARFTLFKNPGLNRVFAVDETVRGSYTWLDMIRVFMPKKPQKYGQKFFCCVDVDLYVHKFIVQYPAQFATWKDMEGLMDQVVPSRFFNCGATIVADNYFFTV